MSHIWMSHVTHMNASRHVTSHHTEWAVPGIARKSSNLNNLLAWLVWGWAFQVMAVTLIVRHFSALGIA